jgi:hypothetical protein
MEDFTLPSVGQGSKDQKGNSQRTFSKPLSSYCLPFWADVVNYCLLAPALARPTQTSLKKLISFNL